MNRFVIVDVKPYLYANGKTYTCRFDDDGFTMGAEVKLASVPDVTYSELSVKAKCAEHLDSIGTGDGTETVEKPKRKTKKSASGKDGQAVNA